ncbi:MAG: hypothetical protein R3350_00810, partial [Saprospiraceae bacterium]|nr:hypothetical protein [Saprospiraceae bacterium]
YLPETAEEAEIFLTDLSGRKIRSFPLREAGYGKVVIESNTLPAGNYIYSLVIDGAVWQSLQMVLTK